MNSPLPTAVASALRTLSVEQQGLAAFEEALKANGSKLGKAFQSAVETIFSASGRVIVTGMGKSGHIARKIAATLASTGQPAAFVHPAEASHGDLGMVQNNDVVLALSWSGESVELAAIITYAKRFAIPLIAVTSRADSALGREADVALVLPSAAEACPNGLARRGARPRRRGARGRRAGPGERRRASCGGPVGAVEVHRVPDDHDTGGLLDGDRPAAPDLLGARLDGWPRDGEAPLGVADGDADPHAPRIERHHAARSAGVDRHAPRSWALTASSASSRPPGVRPPRARARRSRRRRRR